MGRNKPFPKNLRYFASSSLRYQDFFFKKFPISISFVDTMLFTQHIIIIIIIIIIISCQLFNIISKKGQPASFYYMF